MTLSQASNIELVVFERRLRQRIPLHHVSLPSPAVLQCYEAQQRIYTMLDNVTDNVGESGTLVSLWDKEIWACIGNAIEIAACDSAEPEIHDALMERCALYRRVSTKSAMEEVQSDVWVDYSFGPLDVAQDKTLRLLERPRVIANAGCTGHRTWDAALALGSMILDQWYTAGFLTGKTVLELGAGTGLLSFLCAANMTGSARRVIATDGNENAVARLRANFAENLQQQACHSNMSFGKYLWGAPFETTEIYNHIKEQPIDLVIAADVVCASLRLQTNNQDV